MVVGQRADVAVRNRILHRPESVQKEFSAMKGRLHPGYGIDYFAIARNEFPWNMVPDLIIGHPKYDNFLVALASSSNVSVVDATETLSALHQTDEDGVGTGHKRRDTSYNYRVLSTWLPSGCSHIKCTQYRSTWLSETAGSTDDNRSDAVPRQRRRVAVELRGSFHL